MTANPSRLVFKAGWETKMPLALSRLILYARDVEGMVAFYVRHFGFQVRRLPGDRRVE